MFVTCRLRRVDRVLNKSSSGGASLPPRFDPGDFVAPQLDFLGTKL
jgi:hypothetical protein